MAEPKWTGKRVADARAYCLKTYGRTCWLCGHSIDDLADYTVDHVKERSTHPELTWVKSNWRPAHGRRHDELGCPGNFGRSSIVREKFWIAIGW